MVFHRSQKQVQYSNTKINNIDITNNVSQLIVLWIILTADLKWKKT